jgi:hypothetical protein
VLCVANRLGPDEACCGAAIDAGEEST